MRGLASATLAGLLAAAACGGSIATSPDGGDNGGARDATILHDGDGSIGDLADGGALDDGAVQDSAPDSPMNSPVCPSQPPAFDGECEPPDLQCEYGSSDDPLCNVVFRCYGHRWEGGGAGDCAKNGPACPPTYADVFKGEGCGRAAFSVCDYPEGRCECLPGCGQGLPPPDAGSTWICGAAPPGCPSPRGAAHIGAACTTPGLSCVYGVCCKGANQICNDAGYWEGNVFGPAIGGGCP